jgi:cytochrome d ubiquinol oxidase subunit II
MDILPTIWFCAIALLWIGYLILEGFDLGVGMHMLLTARDDTQRRVMLNTIGPVWDGNEVWLITAGAATFAAFPFWYASLFSALYLPLTLVLLGLIFRAVAIEYRGKGHTLRWTRNWDQLLGWGSVVVAFGVGAMLALTTTGLPIDSNGDRVGGPFAWLNGYAIIGGLAVVGFCLVHSAAFLALKTDGDIRSRSGRFVVRWAPILLLPLVAWVLIVQWNGGKLVTWVPILAAVGAVLWAWTSARKGRERRAFAGIALFLGLGAIAIFAATYPVVLPSTINRAYDLTIHNAASGSYTLGVMSIVALIGLPLVLVYQGWTYWVFRKRISEKDIPAPVTIEAAIKK